MPLASSYRLELSRTADFNPSDIVDTCVTINTTFVPIDATTATRTRSAPTTGGCSR